MLSDITRKFGELFELHCTWAKKSFPDDLNEQEAAALISIIIKMFEVTEKFDHDKCRNMMGKAGKVYWWIRKKEGYYGEKFEKLQSICLTKDREDGLSEKLSFYTNLFAGILFYFQSNKILNAEELTKFQEITSTYLRIFDEYISQKNS